MQNKGVVLFAGVEPVCLHPDGTMARQPLSKSQLSDGGRIPLDYAYKVVRETQCSSPITGIISFAGMIAFVPWAVFWFYVAWGNQRQVDALPGHWPVLAVWGPMMLPVLVALGFGIHSLKICGISLRNILGVFGFISSSVILILALLAFYFVSR
jgi:hypothetical protein